MNRIFDWIEKYKFGLIAMVAGYIFIFSTLQVTSYTKHFPISPFQDGPEIVYDEEILLDPDQIEVPETYTGDVKNIARDRNDKREISNDDWSENQPMTGEAYAKAVEQSYKDETGGEAKRAEIREKYEQFKKDEAEKKKQNEKSKGEETGATGGDKKYGGDVLVDWELSGRKDKSLPPPSYMCGKGASGKIVINITVNQNGNVLTAKFNSGASSSSNNCMIQQAKRYALKSRFNYSGTASKSQAGKLFYIFVSQ